MTSHVKLGGTSQGHLAKIKYRYVFYLEVAAKNVLGVAEKIFDQPEKQENQSKLLSFPVISQFNE